MLSFKPVFSLSPSSRGSLVPLHFLPLEWYYLHIWGYWCFSQQFFWFCFLWFLAAVLIPACDSSSPAFCMMYSTYKLNKQVDNIQPCSFLLNQLVFPCLALLINVASWPAHRFLRRQVRWSGTLLRIFQFVVIHRDFSRFRIQICKCGQCGWLRGSHHILFLWSFGLTQRFFFFFQRFLMSEMALGREKRSRIQDFHGRSFFFFCLQF